jgi:hypothetical protein
MAVANSVANHRLRLIHSKYDTTLKTVLFVDDDRASRVEMRKVLDKERIQHYNDNWN